ASRATMQRYTAEARRHCGTAVTDVSAGSQVLATDTLLVAPLNVPDSTIAEAGNMAERGGAFELPARVDRNRVLDDAFIYVVELRRGNDYRASVIEHTERAETRVDQHVRDIYAAVNRLLAPDQVLSVRIVSMKLRNPPLAAAWWRASAGPIAEQREPLHVDLPWGDTYARIADEQRCRSGSRSWTPPE